MTGVSADTSTGLLSLRSDRGDRTLQWAHALADGGLERFHRLFVTGRHARALRHRLRKEPGAKKLEILPSGRPRAVMERILESPGANGDRLLFGFGNMAGLGEALVRHWEEVGEPHGI
jgi:hypothetical protein